MQLTWLKSERGLRVEVERPRLDLSGPLIAEAFQIVARGAEELGGIERYVEALKLKAALFQDTLAGSKVAELSPASFGTLCTFMATVRRRVSSYLAGNGFVRMKAAIVLLLSDNDTQATDERMARFCGQFPSDERHRFIRDVASEVLHNVDPERYPLMSRWVWDAKTNTGTIREIWFGDDVDHMTIPLSDGYATFLMLREELSQYLTGQGVFQDVIFFVDMLIAQIYANYICAQGGTYLRADFSSAMDPMYHTRRILGLDGMNSGSNRRRLKAVDGTAVVLDDMKMLD